MVFCREQYAKALNTAVFPGIQGGPLMHVIAAKAVAMKLAGEEPFRAYQAQILKNAKTLATVLSDSGFRLVSGGTDVHLVLVDLTSKNITGKEAEEALDRAGITVNKNTIPFDTKKPLVTSGIRIGTPALTSRGMKEEEMEMIGGFIREILDDPRNESRATAMRGRVEELCRRFPLYQDRL